MDPETVRRAVAQTYAKASETRLLHNLSGALSGPTGAAKFAGYTEPQLAAVPDGVAASFFGCGNPLAYARVQPGDTVLDLGSGAGLDLILAGQAVGPSGRVIGVDMTDAMIERARANVARAGLANVDIRRGLIEALPVETGSVDWVISNCVISLSPEKHRVFGEIARVLRPNGQMLISDIVVDDRLAWVLRRLTRIAPSIAYAHTEAEYLRAMVATGLVNPVVEDRFVYEADDLIGLFGGAAASTCPVGAIANRLRGRVTDGVLRAAARAAIGHVWSSKFRAQRA